MWVQVTLVAWYVPSGIAAVALTPQRGMTLSSDNLLLLYSI